MTMEQVLNKYDSAVAYYLHEVEAQRKSRLTLINYEKELRLFRTFFVKNHEGEEDVSDPGYLDFQMWRDEMVSDGLSVNTIQRYMTDIRHFYTVVSDEELGEYRFYTGNPCLARAIPSNAKEFAKPYEQILTDEQVAMLWENEPVRKVGVKVANWPRNYAIVMLLLNTEIRNKELLDLKLRDVDFEYKEIQIWNGKGNKYRCVDCPDIAITAIQLYLQSGLRPANLTEDDYLFGNTRPKGEFGTFTDSDEWNRGSSEWLTKLVKRHVKLVTGVEMVGSHDLRHVGARLDLHNGMRAEELQAKLGHSNLTTTQLYSGKLGSKRKRMTARQVYKERDLQAEKNRVMLGVG